MDATCGLTARWPSACGDEGLIAGESTIREGVPNFDVVGVVDLDLNVDLAFTLVPLADADDTTFLEGDVDDVEAVNGEGAKGLDLTFFFGDVKASGTSSSGSMFTGVEEADLFTPDDTVSGLIGRVFGAKIDVSGFFLLGAAFSMRFGLILKCSDALSCVLSSLSSKVRSFSLYTSMHSVSLGCVTEPEYVSSSP